MFAIFLLTVLVCGVLGAPQSENRIIGGELAKAGEITYIVSVKRYASHICGGSILSRRYVLTAAHCVHGFENKPLMHAVQYGITNLQQTSNYIPVAEIIKHEGYESTVYHPNDVALLKLTKDINLSPGNVETVKLPMSPPSAVLDAILAGWGKTETENVSQDLLKVKINLYTDDICKKYVFGFDNKVHLCAGDLAGGHGQCQGDSGGPLVANGYQYGVVSFSLKPCASPKKPGVFARISSYVDWIKKHSDVL